MDTIRATLSVMFIYSIALCLVYSFKSYEAELYPEAVVWLVAAVLSGLCAYGTIPKEED
jgi:hypothetical protein